LLLAAIIQSVLDTEKHLGEANKKTYSPKSLET